MPHDVCGAEYPLSHHKPCSREQRGALGIIIVRYSGTGGVLRVFSPQSPRFDKMVWGRPGYLVDAGDVCFVDTERKVFPDLGLLTIEL